MATPAGQAKAQELNNKIQIEASGMIDEIEREYLRKYAREAYMCSVKCYDTAGSTGSSDTLENCTRKCQIPHQQAGNIVQQVRHEEEMGEIRFVRAWLVVGAPVCF